MITKKIYLIKFPVVSIFFLLLSSSIQAETSSPLWDKIQIEHFRSHNPFKPVLPDKEEIEKIIPKQIIPVKIEEPKQALWEKVKRIHQERPKKIEIPVDKSVSLPQLNITGLIWNTERPQAIVNGRVVDIGDSIESFEIVAIRKTGIDIYFNGKTITITP